MTLTVAQGALLFRNLPLALYLRGLWGAAVLTATLWAFVTILQVAPPDGRDTSAGNLDLVPRFAAPTLLLFVWICQSVLLSGRIPAPNGRLVAGVGYLFITWLVRQRMEKPARAAVAKSSAHQRPSPRSIATLITAFILPPAGAIASHLQLRDHPNDETQIVLRISLWVAYALAILVAAAVVLPLIR